MAFTYDRATTKTIYGIPPEYEYGRWNGTFANGLTSWRRLVATRITGGTLNTLRILVVGCGLGLMVEGLKDEGFQRAWGINLDDYFASLWDQANCPVSDGTMQYVDPVTKTPTPVAAGQRWPCEVRSDIRPLLGKYDVRTLTATQIGTLTGLSGAQRKFDLVITEDVMTNYAIGEHEAVYAAIDGILVNQAAQVKHYITVNWDSSAYGLNGGPNWDLTQWTASLGGRTNHVFADIAGVTAQAAAPPK